MLVDNSKAAEQGSRNVHRETNEYCETIDYGDIISRFQEPNLHTCISDVHQGELNLNLMSTNLINIQSITIIINVCVI